MVFEWQWGEFNNEGYRQMNEKLNIETCTTAAESPFSNGTVECYNLIVAEAMKKTSDDEKCVPEIALLGQLVSKMHFRIILDIVQMSLYLGPLLIQSQFRLIRLPSLEAARTNVIVRVNLNTLHAVRKSNLEAESSQKILRALRSNVRTYVNEGFMSGDSVFYGRQNYKGWCGPVNLLGMKGQCVLIRHRNTFSRM